MAILRIGLPKGSLQNSTFDLFARAGYRVSVSSRSFFPTIDDETLEAILFRAQEMSRFVEDGVVDLGLTGHDWIRENGSDVVEVAELVYSKATARPAQWILAVPEESPVKTPEQLEGGLVATELVRVTTEYFKKKGVNVKVEFSWGATEVKARILDRPGQPGAIVELTETGSSLRANRLRRIETILTSTARLIANKAAWADPVKREKIESIALHLTGAIEARAKVGLKMNVPAENLAEVTALLPAERAPTVSQLSESEWVAVETILEEKTERDLVPQLKRAGASGIIVYPLNKVIP